MKLNKYILTTLVFSILFFVSFSQTTSRAKQINDINKYFSLSQKNAYSQAIDLLSYSTVINELVQGKRLTILLQDDEIMGRLSDEEKNLLFVVHDGASIDAFFDKYTIDQFWDVSAISNALLNGVKELSILNRLNNNLKLSRHLNSYLVTYSDHTESNIVGNILAEASIIYFL
jgi:hypothetical protein